MSNHVFVGLSRGGNFGGKDVNATEIVNRYVADLTQILQAIDPNEVQQVIDALDATRGSRARIFVIGNGGSAATAQHLCTDLSVGLRGRGLQGFDVQCLNDNTSIATAVSNDVAYEKVFTAQLEGVLTADDVLLAISASGNSPNILSAVDFAHFMGATVVGCSGFDGGELKRLSDVSFHVPTTRGSYGLVEDVHLVLNHILHTYYVVRADRPEAHTAASPSTAIERKPGQPTAESGWVQIRKAKDRRKWQPTPNLPS